MVREACREHTAPFNALQHMPFVSISVVDSAQLAGTFFIQSKAVWSNYALTPPGVIVYHSTAPRIPMWSTTQVLTPQGVNC